MTTSRIKNRNRLFDLQFCERERLVWKMWFRLRAINKPDKIFHFVEFDFFPLWSTNQSRLWAKKKKKRNRTTIKREHMRLAEYVYCVWARVCLFVRRKVNNWLVHRLKMYSATLKRAGMNMSIFSNCLQSMGNVAHLCRYQVNFSNFCRFVSGVKTKMMTKCAKKSRFTFQWWQLPATTTMLNSQRAFENAQEK